MRVPKHRFIIAHPITDKDPQTDTKHDLLSPSEFGAQYLVESIDMGQSFTSIQLAHNHQWYNSVIFRFTEHGQPLDIYRDLELNPYLATINTTNRKKGDNNDG